MSEAKSDRNGTVEIARFIAAIGIVWFHEHTPFRDIAIAGLSTFFVFLIFFSMRRHGTNDTLFDAVRQNALLIKLWIVWSIVYAIARIAAAIATGKPIGGEFSTWMLFTGPSLHLWFLPFSFVIVLLFCTINKVTVWLPHLLKIGLVLAVMGTVAYYLTKHGFPKTIPEAQYISVLPATIYAYALSIGANTASMLMPVSILGICLLAFAPPNGYIAWALGGAIASLSLLVVTSSTSASAAMGRISLTIYLVHPAVSSAIKTAKLNPEDGILTAVIVIVLSVALSAALDRWRFKHLLLLR